jgi:hypothetical protein
MKRTIYISDDLDRRARAAGLNVSGACQPCIGYAVQHGELGLLQLISDASTGHQEEETIEAQPAGSLRRIEEAIDRLTRFLAMLALAAGAVLVYAGLRTLTTA